MVVVFLVCCFLGFVFGFVVVVVVVVVGFILQTVLRVFAILSMERPREGKNEIIILMKINILFVTIYCYV